MDKFLLKLLGLRVLNKSVNRLLGHYVTIYMIHRSAPIDCSYKGISLSLLEQCLIYAKNNNYHFASIDEIVNDAMNGVTQKKPTVCFTIDDGFNDQVEDIASILLKYDAKPTIFVLTDFIDGIDWPWDFKISYIVNNTSSTSTGMLYNGTRFTFNFTSVQKRAETRRALVTYAKYNPAHECSDFIAAISTALNVQVPRKAPADFTPTSWERLRHFESLGLKIGSHACTHHVFTSLTLSAVREELNRAKDRLTAELRSPSDVFCYPSGTAKDFSPAHANLVCEAGYKAAVTAIPGNSTHVFIQQNPFTITRHSVPETLARFARYSSWLEVIRGRFALSLITLLLT